MSIGFDNISQHIIPINDFRLKWRFTEEEYDMLPEQHLNQLKPLDKEAAKFLHDYFAKTNLYNNFPFKKDFFRTFDTISILEGNENEIKKWLYQRRFPFDKPVFLSWDESNAMIVPWKLLIKYFDSFYYGASDDLTVIDQSLNWALLFFHKDEIYFGTNENYQSIKTLDKFDSMF